jgi:WD40 repeat protein
VRTGWLLARVPPEPRGLGSDLSQDSTKVVSAGSLRVGDTATGRQLAASPLLPAWVQDPHFTGGDGHIAFVRMTQGRGIFHVALWDWRKGSAAAFVDEDGWNASSAFPIAVSADGRRMAVSLDKLAIVYDTATGNRVAILPEHPGWVTALTFAPDARSVVTACGDGVARTWTLGGPNRPAARFLGHQGRINDIRFSPVDGNSVATAGEDGTVRTWRLPVSTRFLSPGSWTLDADVTQSGEPLVVTAQRIGQIMIWPMAGKEARSWTLDADVTQSGEPLVVTAQRIGQIMIWPMAGKEARRTISTPSEFGWVQHARFIPDGTKVVAVQSGGQASVVARWKSESAGWSGTVTR